MTGKLFFFICLIFSLNAYAQEIVFLTHNVEGTTFLDEKHHLRGIAHGGRRAFSIEIVHEMRKRLNKLGPTRVLPFKRGFELVKTLEAVVFFNVNRTAQRETAVQWVGPLIRNESFFVDNKNQPTFVTNMEDLKNLPAICVVLGNVHDESLVARGFTNLVRMNSYEGCAKMLKSGRANITILATDSSLFEREEYKDILHITSLPYEKSASYIALSPAFSQQEVEKWQRVFDELLIDGTYQKLYKELYQ